MRIVCVVLPTLLYLVGTLVGGGGAMQAYVPCLAGQGTCTWLGVYNILLPSYLTSSRFAYLGRIRAVGFGDEPPYVVARASLRDRGGWSTISVLGLTPIKA